MNRLRVILPDQLDYGTISTIAASEDAVLMVETGYLFQSTVHKRKLILLASAGRHFALELGRAMEDGDRSVRLDHRTIAASAHLRSLSGHIVDAGRSAGADSIVAIRPGSWSELSELERAAGELGVDLTIEQDSHFYSTPGEFAEHASGRKTLVMEYFYRELRRRHDVLMETGPRGPVPVGGEWNYDGENRQTFGKHGPGEVPDPFRVEPDSITLEASADVERAFPNAPGEPGCDLPVTAADAQAALADFVRNRLPLFGKLQDAMWSGERTLYHSLLSSSLNIKLLSPRDAIAAAELAYRTGTAPLNSVEGFIRQILGWREFTRGIYYLSGPEYEHSNELDAHHPLPDAFWSGRTDMACISDVMSGVLRNGYAHHIERLMVMGLYAMLYGADPKDVHRWHLSYYIDAYDWVSSPNVIGMSQYADGGLLATKPYAASGNYIRKMSNHCSGCPFHPAHSTGERACPITTLYWNFLARHKERLRANRRMVFQVKNLEQKDPTEIDAIARAAAEHRSLHAS